MNNQGTYNISNEHLLLIDILNNMYNDNLRQITNLNASNSEIRNLIVQILNNENNTNLRRGNNRNNQRSNRNTNMTTNSLSNNFGRIVLNNIPYVIDSIEQVSVPLTRDSNSRSNDFSRVLQSFFDPVDVFPTPAQIETATRRVRYCDIVSPKNVSCPISLTNFGDNDMVTVIRHCGHIFNTNELSTWFRSHCNCPVCRYDIRNDNSNASSLFSEENQHINITPSVSNSSNIQPEILSSEETVERNASSIINNWVEDFMIDYNSSDVNNDTSSNVVSSALLGLLNQLNNRNLR